jgi:hypothetical protein
MPGLRSANAIGPRGIQKAYLARSEQIRERTALVERIEAARGEYETKSQFDESAIPISGVNPRNASRSHYKGSDRRCAR